MFWHRLVPWRWERAASGSASKACFTRLSWPKCPDTPSTSRSTKRSTPPARRLLRRRALPAVLLRQAGRAVADPGTYFRLQLIGFFEGVGSERGIAWRVADSLSLRRFLGYGLDEETPDHVALSRTRRLLDAETHQAVCSWVLERLAAAGLLRGKTIGVDATARSQCRDALDLAARHRQELSRVLAQAGRGEWRSD